MILKLISRQIFRNFKGNWVSQRCFTSDNKDRLEDIDLKSEGNSVLSNQ
jgi:hypothetical protein